MADSASNSVNKRNTYQPRYSIDPLGALIVAKLLANQDTGDLLGKVASVFWREITTNLHERTPEERMTCFQAALKGVPTDASHAILSAVLRQDPSATEPEPAPLDSKQHVRSFVESSRTDTANAARFDAQHSAVVRFVQQWGWLVHDGKRWQRDQTGVSMRLAKQTARSIYEEAQQAGDDDQAQKLANWANASLSRSRLEAMIKLAESELSAHADEFDTDPYLLNTTNGTLDLRSGSLRPHKPDDKLTRIAGTHYDPDAHCDTWLTYLHQVMDGKTVLVEFLQRAAGYTLTGITSEHCLFFLYGNGRNGKSTFTSTLESVCGDYATRLKSESLMLKQQNGSNANGDIAKLTGTRMVIASELKSSRRMDEALVKDLTGGETITARFLFRKEFTFQPTFKLWMYGNNQPIIRDVDQGIWSRILMVPFTVFIPLEKRDRELQRKLRSELPGILAWMIRGCLLWQRDGLNPPDEVKAATEEYRTDMDEFGRFIQECCVVDPKTKIASRALYNAFCRWNGDVPKDKVPADFGQELRKRGLKPERFWSDGERERGWIGIGLRE